MNYKSILTFFVAVFVLASCHKKLDRFPTNDTTSETVYSTPLGYKRALAKAYVSMAVTGTNGRDIPREIVSDEGNTGFVRQLWYLQSLSTDEAGWNWSGDTDPLGIHQQSWSPVTMAVAGLYYRCYYTITVCNSFISECAEDKVSGRGITGADAENIKHYKAEARFLRAYNYFVLLDNFGNVPFTDETYVIGSGVLPPQLTRTALFNYIESELLAIDADLVAAKTNEYGRVDKAAAWALLSRLYLNAQVYTGTPKFTECIANANKVIGANYSLHSDYTQLMLADNNTLTNEFIWAIPFDGTKTQSYAGTTFLVHAPAGIPASLSGTTGTWDCIKIPEQFVDKFGAADVRGQFWTTNQTKAMNILLGDARSGYSSSKYRNLTRAGAPGPNTDAGRTYVDVDFPVFRLAEIYLNYAEAVIRGGTGGNAATALGYLQALAHRARPTDAGYANYPQMTLPYIIDERGRELFWECQRRTDLIRFNLFTTNAYLWDWKGGVRTGTAVDAKYNLYPIPSIDMSSNTNLDQNPGY